jgi:WD40 repeat protein
VDNSWTGEISRSVAAFVLLMKYDAFISYSFRSDRPLAAAVQRVLRRAGVPRYRHSPVRICRDDTTFAAGPSVWGSIEQEIRASRYLVLLASPEAAASDYVGREVALWRQERSPETLLIALAGGDLVWDDEAGDFDWERTTALPLQMRGWLPAEPLWVDLRQHRGRSAIRLRGVPRFRTEVTKVAATVRGVSTDELLNEDLRQQRNAIMVLATLLVLVVLAGGVAVWQRSVAIDERNRAIAGRVAAESAALLEVDPSLAMQLAVAAHDIADTPASRGALFNARSGGHAGRLLAHQDPVGQVAVSDDGAVLVSSSSRYDADVLVWHLAGGQDVPVPIRLNLPGERDVATSSPTLAFAPGSRLLAVGRPVGEVRLWDLSDPKNPKEKQVLRISNDEARGVAFSRDGKRLAVAGLFRTWLWDVRDGAAVEPATFVPDAPPATDLAFNGDGTVLYTVSLARGVNVFDVTETANPRTLPAIIPDVDVEAVAVAPDGKRLATGGAGGRVQLWDLADPRKPVSVHDLRGDSRAVTALAFAGDQLLTGGFAGTLRRFDAEGRPAAPARTSGFSIDAIAVVNGTVVTGSRDGVVRLWHDPDPVYESTSDNVFAVALSPDGRTIAAGTADGHLILHRVDQGHLAGRVDVQAHPGAIAGIAFTPDGAALATAAYDGTAKIWRLGDSGPRECFQTKSLDPSPGFSPIMRTVAISRDGRLMAIGGNDVRVVLYDITNPCAPEYRSWFRRSGSLGQDVETVAFSPDSTLLAVGRLSDPVIRIWDVRDPKLPRETATLRGHSFGIRALAFSPNGTLLASGSDDATALLWDVSGLRPNAELRPVSALPMQHGKTVAGLEFSDDRRLVTGSYDNTVRVWDISRVDSPQEWVRLPGARSAVESVTVDQAGITVFAGTDDARLLGYSLDPRVVREWVCRTAGSRITDQEWDRYVPEREDPRPC